VNTYVGYSEGSRAPTSIELGCADPNEPCKLPNAMAGDPPLNQVVTRTWEAGVRGTPGGSVSWNAGVFRAENRDDLLLVASGQTGFGYFKNFGVTRRQGIELGVNRRIERVTIGAGYTYLDATYQSAETIMGSSNSTNSLAIAGVKGLDGTIQIVPGDSIPIIKKHTLKAFADIQAAARLSVDVDLVGVSSSFARGNENNLHQPDGTYYLGPGITDGYAVLNFGARYQVSRMLQLLAQVNNVADRHYDTAAQLGPAGFTATGTFNARPFVAAGGDFPIQHTTFFGPGAPRTFWVGTRVRF
jgi:outer membrane receptor protein involved in Fe transport